MTNALFTAYCACALCCGPGPAKPTASGFWPVQGRTIAAPRAVPLRSWVRITVPGAFTNAIFRVEDRTARRFDGRWDVFFRSHAEALRFGKRKGTVAPP